jgi:hypothetical protein
MTTNEIQVAARIEDVNIHVLVESATKLSAKQRRWVLDIYTPLSGLYTALTGLESVALVHRNAAARSTYEADKKIAMSLIEKVDTAYERVFMPGPAFEPSYMFCDGEITFACAEALKRLRAVVLFHKG